MSFHGFSNWRPNPDGTFGPNHWTKAQLHRWARCDIANTRGNIAMLRLCGVLLFVAMLLASLVGCKQLGLESTQPEPAMMPYCSEVEDRQKVIDFIRHCGEAAKPTEDVTVIDIMQQCQRTAEEILCPKVKHCWDRAGWRWNFCQ